ncbi:MAG: xanthine dehydrogenase accessory factor [Chthoniobacter sp.]|jgi:xanthine dehydrogenase accessory factor|nr:xanthine dehydrogenase accessory factor [Chthoniobacter sp.]
MSEDVLQALLSAREQRLPCALVTVASTIGSVPREAGAKMLVLGDGRVMGTIGGGMFEALVIEESRTLFRARLPALKTYVLHEGAADSFGAICGGEVTILIEPQIAGEAVFLIGAGHCARAIAELAQVCGLHVTAVDDRADLCADFPAPQRVSAGTPAEFIGGRTWQRDEALVLVSRNFEIDRDALQAAVQQGGMGYLGMIGSRKKVRQVREELVARGISAEQLAQVYAPIGLDIGADSPAEIAVSVVAEILQVLRGRAGGHKALG